MRMIAALIALLVLASCTNDKTLPPQLESKTAVVEKSDEIPAIQIDMVDRSCAQDSDCEHIGTQCSCGCGEGVNKVSAGKYKTQLEELCRSYSGKMCKVLCNGKVMCKEKICTYVR